MITLEQFFDNSLTHDICEDYEKKWKECVSKADVFRMACEIQPISYLVKAVSEGWGISPECLSETFPRMINGGYIVNVGDEKKNYTSTIWCMYKGDLIANTTVCCLIDCDCDLYVSKNNACMIYIDKTSKVRLHCKEGSEAIVETYSDKVTSEKGSKIRIKKL